MALVQEKEDEYYTYTDYLEWDEDPDIKSVHVFILDENCRYITTAYDETEKVPVTVLKSCTINLQPVFSE